MVNWFTNRIKFLFPVSLLMLMLAPQLVSAQEYPGFPDKISAELNTAHSADYLTEEEKEVILLINLIRYDGAQFWESLAKPYIQAEQIAASRYTRSLEKDLNSSQRLQPLHPNKTLYNVAKRHAVASGKEGKLGHTSSAGTFEQRLKPLIGEFNYLLENSDYGSSEAMDIVMNLMIDDGIPDVGHRKNIMHEKVNTIGVAIAPHKTYRHTCVQVFGQKLE